MSGMRVCLRLASTALLISYRCMKITRLAIYPLHYALDFMEDEYNDDYGSPNHLIFHSCL